MAKIELIDVSIRDGNQCLWGAVGLDTPQILSISPLLDRIGFRALDYTSSTHMGVAVRNHRQDPWERIRLTHEAMPNTPLQFIGTGLRFISWDAAHPAFMQLVYDRLVANGISRFVVLDPMHDVEALRESARMIRKAGGTEIIAALTFTLSDVHTDDFYGDLAAALASSPCIDRFYIKDPSGLLSAERVRTLVPKVLARIGPKALELHSHCTIGLSAVSYMHAAELGVQGLQVALGPLANGSSLPDAVRVVANLRELGHTVDIDDRLLGLAADYFTRLANAENLPFGTPQDFDASYLRHQVAGGTISTTRRQLAELKLEHRFGDLIREVVQVRAELGYPIMVTPFPQMVCTQALYNLIGQERYASVSDPILRYVLGKFGRPSGPVDPQVRNRILDRSRAQDIEREPPPADPEELRRKFGAGISDEEFLLRAVMPPQQVDAMIAAGPASRHYNPDVRSLFKLLRGLKDRPGIADLRVEKSAYRLALQRGRGPERPRA